MTVGYGIRLPSTMVLVWDPDPATGDPGRVVLSCSRCPWSHRLAEGEDALALCRAHRHDQEGVGS